MPVIRIRVGFRINFPMACVLPLCLQKFTTLMVQRIEQLTSTITESFTTSQNQKLSIEMFLCSHNIPSPSPSPSPPTTPTTTTKTAVTTTTSMF
jgi:hypothetical protein